MIGIVILDRTAKNMTTIDGQNFNHAAPKTRHTCLYVTVIGITPSWIIGNNYNNYHHGTNKLKHFYFGKL